MSRKFGRVKAGTPRADRSLLQPAAYAIKNAAGIVAVLRSWSIGEIATEMMKKEVEDSILNIESGLIQIEQAERDRNSLASRSQIKYTDPQGVL